MARLYIDTNVFMGFYRGATDSVELLDEILPFARYLIIPEQSLSEFKRNRLRLLNDSLKLFRDSINFRPYCTSLIKHQLAFSDLVRHLEDAKAAAKEVARSLESAKEAAADPIAGRIYALFNAADAQAVPTTEALILAAHHRKLLGNPPSSKDRNTIGDELIWESLLGSVSDDLVIVSEDKGFLDYEEVLAEEYQRRTKKRLLAITPKLSEGLTKIGQTPPPSLEKKEAEEEQRRRGSMIHFASGTVGCIIERLLCPICGENEAVKDVVDTKAGEHWEFLICRNCGQYSLER